MVHVVIWRRAVVHAADLLDIGIRDAGFTTCPILFSVRKLIALAVSD